MALVARDELGIDPAQSGHQGADHPTSASRTARSLEALWGADVFDTYGMQRMRHAWPANAITRRAASFRGRIRHGGQRRRNAGAKMPGAQGTIFITTLFKHVAPMIRLQHERCDFVVYGDVPMRHAPESITKIYGRSDNMVKLRGVNVFPEAVGAIISRGSQSNGEYVCVLERDANQPRRNDGPRSKRSMPAFPRLNWPDISRAGSKRRSASS